MSIASEEQWRPIPGYEGLYEVSDQGRVRSLDRTVVHFTGKVQQISGVILKRHLNTQGRPIVVLARNGTKRTSLIHVLIAAAFIGPRPADLEVCHNDGDRTNNLLTNLRYDTRSENALDQIRHGTHSQMRKTHCPRKHPLIAPNLVLGEMQRGGRSCLACARAHNNVNHAKRHGQPHDFEAWADDHFARIMGRSLVV